MKTEPAMNQPGIDRSSSAPSIEILRDLTRERMLRELASDLADLVASGDMTDTQANEWYVSKADQWNY